MKKYFAVIASLLLAIASCHTETPTPVNPLANTKWHQIMGSSCCDTIIFSDSKNFTSTRLLEDHYTLISQDSVRFTIDGSGTSFDCKFLITNHDTLKLFCYQRIITGGCNDVVFEKE